MNCECELRAHRELLHWLLVDKFEKKEVRFWWNDKMNTGRVVRVLPEFTLEVLVDQYQGPQPVIVLAVGDVTSVS